MTAAQLLKPCPASGEGVHNWVFYAACSLIEAALSDVEAEAEIEAAMTREPNPASEITDALRSARGDHSRSRPRWSPVNPAAIAEIVETGPTLLELISRSPEPIQFVPQSRAEMFIDTLFPGNPLLCVGRKNHFYTDTRETFRGHLHARELIVPSPMSAQMGRTKQGKMSYRSESNTGTRRFLVVEFDRGTLDQQAALLWHLAGRIAPLALVVFSGGKSLHGWFYCAGQREEKLERFFRYAASLGADTKTWSRCQFVRMPDGQRADGKTSDALKLAGIENVPSGRQAVLYFNPGVIR